MYAIGADHAGFTVKEAIIAYLEQKNRQLADFGTYNDESADYPDFAHPLADAIEQGQYRLGILICGSGNGVCITANKHQGVRAALCFTPEMAKLARQHNNANVLCLSSRFVSLENNLSIVDAFVEAEAERGRHARRVNKIAVEGSEFRGA